MNVIFCRTARQIIQPLNLEFDRASFCVSRLMILQPPSLEKQAIDKAWQANANALKLVADNVTEFSPRIEDLQLDDRRRAWSILREFIDPETDPEAKLSYVRKTLAGRNSEIGMSDVIRRILPLPQQSGMSRDAAPLLVSEDDFLNTAYLLQSGSLSDEAMLAILASVGIEIALPNFTTTEKDTIEALRNQCEEERVAYVNSIRSLLRELGNDLLATKVNYADCVRIAERTVKHDVKLALLKYEEAMKKQSRPTLKKLGVLVWDELPSIGTALATSNPIKGAAVTLKILTRALKNGKSLDEQTKNMARYAFKLGKLQSG